MSFIFHNELIMNIQYELVFFTRSFCRKKHLLVTKMLNTFIPHYLYTGYALVPEYA
jgi:hypothetical protein